MGTWFFYVVECRDKSWYAGVTTDILRRVRQHNGELAGGAKYTRGRRPVRLLFIWPYSSQAAAQRAEAQYKALSKPKKLYFITYAHDIWERNHFGERSSEGED